MLFSLVSKTLSDTVDENTKSEVFSFIKKVIDANMKELRLWRGRDHCSDQALFSNRMQPSDQFQYSMLQKMLR